MTAPPADLGILTTDADLVIRSWDGWLEAATGLAAGLVRGQPLDQVVPDLESRGLLLPLKETLTSGVVQILAPAFHHFFIPCPPRSPSRRFTRMQQRTTAGPLYDGEQIAGLILWIEDVTAQLDAERDLAAALMSDDDERRRDAAAAIEAAGQVHSLESFEPALESADWRVRAVTVQGLSRVADAELLLSVVATLRREHRNFNVLSSALKLLAMSDATLTGPLTVLLQDHDADLRIQAALALGDQHDLAAADSLIAALDDPDTNVRFHVIEALGRLRAHVAVEPLTAIVESGDFFLAFPALEALTLIGDARVAHRLVALLPDPLLREAVARALGAFGDDASVAPLAGALDSDPEAARPVALALASIEARYQRQLREGRYIVETVRAAVTARGKGHLLAALRTAPEGELPALVTVIGWLRGDDVLDALAGSLTRPAIRDLAADALVAYGEAAGDVLIPHLEDDDADARRAAIDALGRLGSRRATPALTPLLDLDDDTVVAVNAALARIGDPAAFEPLIELIGHRNTAVRQSAIGALNSIGHGDMARRVASLLTAPDPLTRESAVRIAGYFGYPETADLLFERLSDSVEAVRTAALEQLPFLDDPRVLPALESAARTEAPRARAAAVRSLGRLPEPASLMAVIRATEDPDAWVRYYAARALGELRQLQAVPALARLVESDPAPHVRIAALDAIGVLGAGVDAGLLSRAVTDSDAEIAGAALRALGRTGAPDALPLLLDAARHPEASRRLAAVAALAAHGSPAAVEGLQWVAGTETAVMIRTAAVDGLGAIAAAGTASGAAAVQALLALCADPGRREAAIVAISGLPPAMVAEVARGLQDPQVGVRRGAVDSLARFRDHQASLALADALADASPLVREDAIRAMARLGVRDLDGRIADLARDDPAKSVRRAAAEALSPGRLVG